MINLDNRELKQISKIMDELLSDPHVQIQKKFSGGFNRCEMFDYDNDFIDLELIFGVQDDVEDTVHKEQYRIDRITMNIVN